MVPLRAPRTVVRRKLGMALSIGLSRAPRTGLAVAWVWVDELGFFVCLFSVKSRVTVALH